MEALPYDYLRWLHERMDLDEPNPVPSELQYGAVLRAVNAALLQRQVDRVGDSAAVCSRWPRGRGCTSNSRRRWV